MRNKRRKKRKKKPRKIRNFLAISAWFRRSGPMRDKKKERNKKLGRKKIEKDEQ